MSKKNRPNPTSKKKLSKKFIKEIGEAGLPTPDLGMSKQEYAKLQKQWYAKLAKTGFSDIEWVDHTTGLGHDSAFLRGSLSSGKAYHPGRAIYFELATNYLQHCRALHNRPYHHFIWRLHAEGMTYDEIEQAVYRQFRQRVSKYTLYYQIKDLAKLCYLWNAKYPEGLLVKRAEDKAAIEQKNLDEFYQEEYNWMINKEFAAREAMNGKRFRKSRRR